MEYAKSKLICSAVCLAVVLLCGCHSRKPSVSQSVVERRMEHDTVYIHDSERVIKGHDTVRIRVPYAVARNYVRDTVSRLETPLAWSVARVDTSGMLYHILAMKENAAVAADQESDTVYVDKVIYRDRNSADNKERIKKVYVPPSWKERMYYYIVGGLVGLVLGAALTGGIIFALRRKK